MITIFGVLFFFLFKMLTYEKQDPHHLLNNIKSLNINSVLTTEKDALKLPDWFIGEINLFILQMVVVFPPRQERVLLDSVKSVLL